MKNAISITSTSNTYKWCYIADKGAIYYLDNTPLTDSGGSQFLHNAAVSGGAIYCKGSALNLA
jgi:predicted outer membrane repeat protein